ncbi:hypothetical protein GF389_06110 [Candidatus Dojkabacteria bacterium]|nr:hypothetical protein [Candidatus Dojkabacteria bacterium]
MKLKALFSQKVLNSLFAFLLLITLVSPVLRINEANAQENDLPEDVQEELVENEVSDEAEEVEEVEEIEEEKSTESEEDSESEVSESEEEGNLLSTAVEETKVTYGGIQRDTSYVYPHNEAVSIKFLSLPEGDYSLTIEEVETEYGSGYEFTSDLRNGTFLANLRLPNDLGKEDVEVKYSEDGANYSKLEDVMTVDTEEIVVYSLNHFTTFVVVEVVPASVTEGVTEVDENCDVSVGSGDYCYSNLRDALTAANDGDDILIKSGTYNFTGSILINNEVDITCEEGAKIVGPGYDYGMFIRRNNVTLTGCDISGFQYGVLIEADQSLVSDPSTIEIHDNYIHDNTSHSIRYSSHRGVVNATGNYFGTDYGPFDDTPGDGTLPDTNTGGKGGEIQSFINYSNWIEYPPSVPSNIHFDMPSGEVLGCGDYTNELNVTVDWDDSTDNDNEVDHYVYKITFVDPVTGAESIWTTTVVDSEFSGSFAPKGEGMRKIQVKAVDMRGNESDWSEVCSITYDVTPPAQPSFITIYNRETDEEIGCGGVTPTTKVDFEWNLNTEDDVAGYWFGTKFNDYHQYFAHPNNYKTANMTPGNNPYHYSLIAVDEAGNESETSELCYLTLDTEAPAVEVTSHNDGDVVKGDVLIEGTITDENNDHYWFVVEGPDGYKYGPGVVYNSDPSINASMMWDTTELENGTYTIKLEARDAAGNKEPDEAPVSADPEVDGDSVDWVEVEVKNVGSIQGRKYEDANMNGIHDNNTDEPRLNGWMINLYKDGDEGWEYLESSETQTRDQGPGQFRFTDLPFGTYYVCEELEEYSIQTGPILGAYPINFDGTQTNDALAVENESGESNEGAVCWEFTIDEVDEAYGWVKFGNYLDDVAPEVEQLAPATYFEGEDFPTSEVVNATDDKGLEKLHLAVTTPSGVTYEDYFAMSGSSDSLNLGELLESLLGYDVFDTSLIEEGDYVLEYYAVDLVGNESEKLTVTYTLENVEPDVTLNADQTINEGETASFTGSFTDPSSVDAGDEIFDDALWWPTIDYGDGTVLYLVGGMDEPGVVPAIPDHVYDEDGTYTVTLWVCEDKPEYHPAGDEGTPYNDMSEGECGMATVTVTVNNVVPVVSISTSPGTTTTEQAITLTASYSGDNSPVTVHSWDCNFAVSGTPDSVTTPATPDTYTCTVTVVDVDGDTATATQSVTVNEAPEETPPAATGAADTGNVLGIGDNVTEEGEENGEEVESTEEEGEVLGEMTCDVTSKVSGFVYYDENDNNEKDEDEGGLEDVRIELYVDMDGERTMVVSVRTDENGYWEADVCPGNYDVEVNEDDLPEDSKLDGDAVLGISVNDEDGVNDINFEVGEEGGSILDYWWIPLLCLLLLAALAAGGYVLSRREER